MPSKIVRITWHEGLGVPDNELPWAPPTPGHPDNDLPWAPAYPSHGLPGGGHISTLPVFPFDPSLPIVNPPPALKPIAPGAKFIVKWIACVGLALVPDNSLPETPEPK